MNRLFPVLILAALLLMLDVYAVQAVEAAFQYLGEGAQSLACQIFWGITALGFGGIALYNLVDPALLGQRLRTFLMLFVFTLYISKLFLVAFLLLDDARRVLIWAYELVSGTSSGPIERSVWLAWAGMVSAAFPVLAILWGVLRGAHHYQVKRKSVFLPHLPEAFDGFTIAHISDIHAGTFWSKTSVQAGVELLNAQGADVVCFTGDLVNNEAGEMNGFVEIFSQIQAPHGVFSVLGNHDYGDYLAWPSREAKQQNLRSLIELHGHMGWKILLNEHHIIEKDGHQLAVLGIENWSAKARFPQYGSLADAYQGAEAVPVKILLSHDPSHWRAEVLEAYPDIDLTLSGHTHGMQFGLDFEFLRWSPVQYVYREWADLYREGMQYLYVNRGFGYLGFPGRIGMRPEITLIELRKGDAAP
ncbi:MAG: metallophosphoesterase [Bacteroidetes bacterium]|nr:MAG: metallophosphoesterase [Bacteroidota bacterium]